MATFLSLFTGLPFEIQQSQAFHDGNTDFEWRRGAVMTAKEKGLWKAYGRVSDEDVRHIQSRVHVFRCSAPVPKLKSVAPCGPCMSRWICNGASEYDTMQLLRLLPQPEVVVPVVDAIAGQQVGGLDWLCGRAQLPSYLKAPLNTELLKFGAVDVRELSASEWPELQV